MTHQSRYRKSILQTLNLVGDNNGRRICDRLPAIAWRVISICSLQSHSPPVLPSISKGAGPMVRRHIDCVRVLVGLH